MPVGVVLQTYFMIFKIVLECENAFCDDLKINHQLPSIIY